METIGISKISKGLEHVLNYYVYDRYTAMSFDRTGFKIKKISKINQINIRIVDELLDYIIINKDEIQK